MTEEDIKFEEYADRVIAEKNACMANESVSAPKKPKKKRKRFVVSLIAFFLVATTGITGFLLKNRSKNKKSTSNKKYTTSSFDDLSDRSLNDLGKGIAIDSNSQRQYGNVTGNVDIGSIVVGKDGTYYVDDDARNNAENGSNNNNTSDIIDSNPGYIVVDPDNNIIDQGTGSNIPDGYAWDSGRGEYVPIDQVGKYVYSQYDIYYKSTGTLVIAKGTLVEKARYEEVLNNPKYTTTKPTIEETQESTTPTETVAPTEPTAPTENSNQNSGAYTDSYGNVWASYQDYLNGLENPDDVYYNATDGMLHCDGKNKNAIDPTESIDPELSNYQKMLRM